MIFQVHKAHSGKCSVKLSGNLFNNTCVTTDNIFGSLETWLLQTVFLVE